MLVLSGSPPQRPCGHLPSFGLCGHTSGLLGSQGIWIDERADADASIARFFSFCALAVDPPAAVHGAGVDDRMKRSWKAMTPRTRCNGRGSGPREARMGTGGRGLG